MRGSAAFRTNVTPGGALAGPWVRNPLWAAARAVPSLDLRFAENKSLVDATTGQNLVTFTRASSGTYVDSQGVIRTATTNLVTFSEQFDNAAWNKYGASVTANAVASPTGSSNASKLVEDTSAGGHGIYRSATVTTGLSYVWSGYFKAAERSIVQLKCQATGNVYLVEINLSNQTATTRSGNGTTTITDVGNGWYRVVSIATSTASGTGYWEAILCSAANTASYTGNGTSGLFLWGAQLEQSSTVGEYIPTTSTINSAPRFDHNPTTGESLGLLVEEQRTNLVTTSEALANVTNASITNNTTTAPDGLLTADTLIEDTSTGAHSVNTASITWVGNTVYTFTIFLKANTRSQVNLAFGTSSNWVSGQRSAVFDLSAGTVASSAGSPVVASIEAYPSGWYRCRLTATTVASPVPSTTQIQMYVAGSSSYTGNGTSGLFFWGAQLEAGSFPTSYIPTTTATATRSADVASSTGSNFSSWYRQDEGTVFVETQFPAGTAVNSSSRSVFDVTDGSTNNRVNVRPIGVGVTTDQLTIRSGGSTTAQFSSNGTAVSTSSRRLAAVYKVDDFASWATGATSVATDTSGTLPVGVNQLIIGSNVGATEYLSGTIRRLTYWPQRLPNETLQRITQ